MKLNHDCVRDVLLYLEENLSNKPLKIRNIAYSLENNYQFDEVIVSFQYLFEQKYIHILTPTCTKHSLVKSITASGFDYLEKIRPLTTKEKVFQVFNEVTHNTLSTGIDILKDTIVKKS